MKNLLVVAAVLGLSSCKAQEAALLPKNADNNTLLWAVSGKGLKAPSYMYGTVHLQCKEEIMLSSNVRKAVAQADEVYFEMDLDDAANTLGGLFFMNMKDGRKLSDLYTAEEYTRVSSFFRDSLKMNLQFFEKMKPMMLEVMLYPRMMPCKKQGSVDMELMALAKKEKKEIKGFEDITFQTSILDSIPYETQAKNLLKAIEQPDKMKMTFRDLMNSYAAQNLSQLEKVTSDTADMGSQGASDALLKNRNHSWVKQLREIWRSKNIFMGVGAGHLVGKDGLIALLRKEGYTVTPIENRKGD